MKSLNGSELADYIKERQAKQVRALRQADGVIPKLAIIQTTNNPVIATYVRVKQRYGEDILVEVETHTVSSEQLFETIKHCNQDSAIHGVIVQLPLADMAQTDEAVNLVAPEKDVDGLGEQAVFTPATPMAIDWLLAGYNVTLKERKIGIIGNGRLVGAPLAKLWRTAGHDVTVCDRQTSSLEKVISDMDVIVSAAGVPSLITSTMLKQKAVVVDAATASENGELVGDVADEVRTRDDIAITPKKGGVGPLTVAALFDNVIRAARVSVER